MFTPCGAAWFNSEKKFNFIPFAKSNKTIKINECVYICSFDWCRRALCDLSLLAPSALLKFRGVSRQAESQSLTKETESEVWISGVFGCLFLSLTVKATLPATIVVTMNSSTWRAVMELERNSQHMRKPGDWYFSNVCKAWTQCDFAKLSVYHSPQSATVLCFAGRQSGGERELKNNDKRAGRLSLLRLFLLSVLL